MDFQYRLQNTKSLSSSSSSSSSNRGKAYKFLEIFSARSTTLWLYPHSLSYQATTLTMSSPITMVSEESMVEETSEHLKSAETSGSLVTSRTPLRWPSAASLNTAFTSSVKVFFST